MTVKTTTPAARATHTVSVLWIAILIGVAGIGFEIWRFRRFVGCVAEQFPPDSEPLPFDSDDDY